MHSSSLVLWRGSPSQSSDVGHRKLNRCSIGSQRDRTCSILANIMLLVIMLLGVYRIVVSDYSAEYEIRIRIRIALPAEHFDFAPAVLMFTTSLCPSLITAVPACCLAMTISPSFVSRNQAVWARAAGSEWVKSPIDVTSCSIRVQTNYSYSLWRHYSSQYEYTIRTTFRQWREYEANIRYIPKCY